VPAGTRGNVKVVGLLPGWPFEVRQEPMVVQRGVLSPGDAVLRLIKTLFSE
jgi:hypothetical protein